MKGKGWGFVHCGSHSEIGQVGQSSPLILQSDHRSIDKFNFYFLRLLPVRILMLTSAVQAAIALLAKVAPKDRFDGPVGAISANKNPSLTSEESNCGAL